MIAFLLGRDGHLMSLDERIDQSIVALAGLCIERRWHYLYVICLAASGRSSFSLAQQTFGSGDVSVVTAALLGANRPNEALLYHQAAAAAKVERMPWPPDGAEVRLRASRHLFRRDTDFWVSPESIDARFRDLMVKAQKIGVRRREPWLAKAVVKEFKRLETDLRRGALSRLSFHAGALNGPQWRRLTETSSDTAVHIRFHYSTAFLTAAIRFGGVTREHLVPYALLFAAQLPEEMRRRRTTQIGTQILSALVFEVLRSIQNLEDTPLLAVIYDDLLKPLLEDPKIASKLAAVREPIPLVIAANGALAQLPFAAAFDGERYLIERFDVVQAPPIFTDDPLIGGSADVYAMTGEPRMARPAKFRALTNGTHLAQGGNEIAFFRERKAGGVPIDLLPPETAWTSETFSWLLTGGGVAILSTHLRAAGDTLGRTMLQTPSGAEAPVTQALGSKIDLDLLILSSCTSNAQTDWFSGSEHSLAGYCLRAGASAVISSLWEVNDYAGRLYLEHVVDALAAGASRASAHGIALRALRQHVMSVEQALFGARSIRAISADRVETFSGSASLSHPYYWAAMVLSGAYT